MKIYSVSGKAGSGKDTFAEMLRDELATKGGEVIIMHYADLLKFMCREYFAWDGKKDEYGRGLLQYVGTDKVRKAYPDFWVDYIIKVLSIFEDEWDFVIIPDLRFANEADKMKRAGFDVTTVCVERPCFCTELTKEQQQHSSENAMDGYMFDAVIQNCGSIDDLRDIAKYFAEVQDGQV